MKATHKKKLTRERLLHIVATYLGLDGIMNAGRIHRCATTDRANWDRMIAMDLPIGATKIRGDYVEVKVWLDPQAYLLYEGKRSRPSCDHHVNVTMYGEIIKGRGRGRKRSNVNARNVYCRLDHKWYLATKRLVDLTRGSSANAYYKLGIQTFVCKHLVRLHLKDDYVLCLPTDGGWKICRANGERICDWDESSETKAWVRAYKELIPTVSFFELGIRKYPL